MKGKEITDDTNSSNRLHPICSFILCDNLIHPLIIELKPACGEK